jgi:hypothetical protein
MRSYKKIKKYVGGSLSKNNKGLLLINISDISVGTPINFICTIQNPDGSTSNLVSTLYPVLNSGTGLPFSTPAGNCWSIIPFNVAGITSNNIGQSNIYELF